MLPNVDTVFREIRKTCSAGMWSRAVELSRARAVAGVSASDEEVLCRVRTKERSVAHEVTLFPQDEEWDCDCESKAPCCEHVAAAAIVVRRAHQEGKDLPGDGRSGAFLRYCFSRHKDHLRLERYLVAADGTASLLTKSVAGLAADASGERVTPSQSDIAVDRLMGSKLHGPLTGEALRGVLLTLSQTPHLQFEGQDIEIESDPLKPSCRVEDHKQGFQVVLEADERAKSIVAAGVARHENKLYTLADTEVAGSKWERLPERRVYGSRQVSELVTRVLPELMKRFRVDVRTNRLPRLTRSIKPSIDLAVEQEGNTLSVLATIVYGSSGRIDAGQLVHLGGDVPVRDEEAERRLARRLRDQLDLAPGARLVVNGDAATALAEKLDSYSGSIRGRALDCFIQRTPLTPTVGFDDGQLQLDFSTTAGTGRSATASGDAVIAAWQSGASLVPLSEGGWAPLPDEWLAQHGHRIASLLAQKQATSDGRLPKHALPEAAAFLSALGQEPPDELARLAPLAQGFTGLPRASLPDDLSAPLRDYQQLGVDFLCFLRDAGLGATLADDMGLGKTLQALCALRGRSLVVCPRSLLTNWQSEAKRFRPGLQVQIYHGPDRTLDAEADLTLTTYAILRLDQEALAATHFDCVVLDEAQAIKNPDSQAARAAFRLTADFRLTLSGTPVENRLEELWSQFRFTNPGLLGSRQFFQDQYGTPIQDGKAGAARALQTKIRPFLLRRLKREVAKELPPRTDLTLRCTLSEPERAVYDTIRAATQKEVVERLHSGGSVLEALEALLRLRQAACHTALVPGQQAAASSKVKRLMEALLEIADEGHKALVFSQWTSFLDLVEPALKQEGLAWTRLDGSTRDRGGVVSSFQADDGPPILLLSLKAGGTGLNLTAADHVFLLDPWWNPAVEDQAADRAHRIGQDRPVFVHRLVSENTVEERIVELQERKRAIADAALSGERQGQTITRDDLLALLE